ncbi:hypothetical protein GGR39_003238 [Novosphingobium fluoreni]|uniref:Uncharacterized protein n=1 Tax=Novosphingobium fluoreni TaxID=1391222 RepID=A0A7W6C139_9SPHN|nr:hypothetical protein [Novosphingobium fluoreni]MBB3941558.1 hypothetical protein [Novosphingobium fluoreni]
MPRTDLLGLRRSKTWLLRAAVPVALAASSTMAHADRAADMCLDQRIRQAAAESIGKWAQLYPFARVLIGDDARFGSMSEPTVLQRGADNVVCLASFSLVKPSPTGSAYRVSIDHFAYRVTQESDGLTVSLADLPPTLDGTGLNMSNLVARFSIDGKPYADVLRANQQRFQERRQ